MPNENNVKVLLWRILDVLFLHVCKVRQWSSGVVSPDRQAEQNKHVSLLTPPEEAVVVLFLHHYLLHPWLCLGTA